MKMIHIAICDDSQEDISLLHKYIIKYINNSNILSKICIFTSGEALLNASTAFDLVFLDIAMHGINGIQVGQGLKNKSKNTKIIYITNFPEYWSSAVNHIHAFAYLLKPIKMEAIFSQIDDVVYYLEREQEEAPVVTFEIITIKNGYVADTEFMTFSIKDIFYFQYIGRKIMLKTEDKEYIFVNQMKEVVEKMKPYPFAICHQNYLVNLQYVQKIKGYELFLKNGDKLPVSQKKSAKFREKLNRFIQHAI